MEQAKHTPGPWKYKKWSNCSDSNLQEGFSVTDGKHIVPMNTFEGDFDEAEANARLIAAAPELLEVLQLAADYIDGVRWRSPVLLGIRWRTFSHVPSLLFPSVRLLLMRIATALSPSQLRTAIGLYTIDAFM